jgi:hypothetical protein
LTRILLALLLLAAPAEARRRARHVQHPKAERPEDDVRLKGDAKAFQKVAVSIVAPKDLALLEGDEVRIELQITGYALGALAAGGPVPHAHLIVDNEPALEIDAAAPFSLSGLRPGPHALRLVLCRPWHEVVKAPHAFALARFWLGPRLEGKAGKAAEFVAWPDPKKPILTYVLPIGEPGKDAQDLSIDAGGDPAEAQRAPVLDFYLSGAKLARRGDKVRVVLDKRELPLTTDWKPLPLKRARGGSHKITVDLLDRRGLKVKNAVNRTDRAFAVD